MSHGDDELKGHRPPWAIHSWSAFSSFLVLVRKEMNVECSNNANMGKVRARSPNPPSSVILRGCGEFTRAHRGGRSGAVISCYLGQMSSCLLLAMGYPPAGTKGKTRVHSMDYDKNPRVPGMEKVNRSRRPPKSWSPQRVNCQYGNYSHDESDCHRSSPGLPLPPL